MSVQASKFTIRSRKLGLKLREARNTASKSLDECAMVLSSSVADYELFETGEQSPSLPELEILASFLEIPLEYFWTEREQAAEDGKKKINPRQLIGLRQRKIGALLRAARLQAGLSLEQLSEATSLEAGLIESYEFGEGPIPLPELEVIAQVLNRPLGDFSSKPSHGTALPVLSPATREFLQLSPELQAFIGKPINRPYLELAVRLSQMDADRLRSVAEALLAITY